MEDEHCVVCGADAAHRCSGCQSVRYCSREHQKSHWKVHKVNCRSYRVERSPLVGRHLIACRDLKPGDVVVLERPLVIGPKQAGGPPVCLGCYCNLDGRGVECPQCGWPMCGRTECCSEGSHHALGECALLTAAGRKVTSSVVLSTTNGVYQSIMVLRCLSLRERDPAKWEQLMDLEYHGAARRQNGLEDVDKATVVKLIHQWLPDVPEDLILQLCGVLLVNSFELPAMHDKQSQGLQAVYGTASLIEHDCVANATKTFTKDGQVVVRAAVAIPKGERVALNYTEPMWGTMNRQRHLQQTKFFTCRCHRCKDASELDTYTSGIYCIQCPNQQGILLAEDPFSESADWVCNKCSDRQPASFIASVVETVGKELVGLKRGSVAACESFIRKYAKILHPHHFYLTDVKMALCQMYGHLEGQNLIDMSEEVLSMKEALALELLKIADVISPGLNRLRGILLYELQAVVSVRSRKLCITRDISKDELQAHAKVVRKMLGEAHTIFSWEPEETDEGRLAKIAGLELKDVDVFLKTLE